MVEAKRRPLSRRRVLEAAVRFADREGLESLSMRKLGAELGVEAMSLYNHVPNKDALLDGMVEVLLGELKVPAEQGGWEGRIREAYREFRRLARRHPNIFPLLVVRPPDTMDGVWLVEEYLKTMREAGFDAATALYAFRTLSGYAMGYAMAEIRGFAMEPGGGRAGAAALPTEQFPHLSGLEGRLGEVDRDAEFEFGLDLILSGLRERL
ncbi:MAG: Transcriptional regulator, AcrR family [uncultured Rubrobacteraceae bacterium]|uniref:Transcriptional regulator, AcrR family n=1 Tax=uncultured Rubrobacteraceae bacterium TaxID=349277 RepID=A0A6J4NUR8_9ACTN|nr:MAG: Transcriptional regulator, AcrR family [uncultured Rubrobacteraceae bacterium]